MSALRKPIEALKERYRRRSWDELALVRPEPREPALSAETQAQLHAIGAASAMSEPKRRWLIFKRQERVFAEARPTPDPTAVNWDAMRERKIQ